MSSPHRESAFAWKHRVSTFRRTRVFDTCLTGNFRMPTQVHFARLPIREKLVPAPWLRRTVGADVA
jgi:hypothetical protein